jgi:hypothetical protein
MLMLMLMLFTRKHAAHQQQCQLLGQVAADEVTKVAAASIISRHAQCLGTPTRCFCLHLEQHRGAYGNACLKNIGLTRGD